MVGYNPKQQQLGAYHYALAGGATGFIVRGLTQPLDVLKIRFQLQIEPIQRNSSVSKYRGMLQSVLLIGKEESLTAFWKGHVVAQGLTAVYMAVEFTTFEVFTKYWWHESPVGSSVHQTVSHFAGGGVAGFAATVVSYPLDIIRTRLVAQSHHNPHYRNIYQAVTSMAKEGPQTFSRGMGASLCHTVPQAMLHFGCYHSLKSIAHTLSEQKGVDAACGAAAGVSAKLLVYPFETAKRRLQVIGFEKARVSFGETRSYTSTMNFLHRALKEEGIRGLYKGLTWALLKAGITTGMYFCIYESIVSFITTRNEALED